MATWALGALLILIVLFLAWFAAGGGAPAVPGSPGAPEAPQPGGTEAAPEGSEAPTGGGARPRTVPATSPDSGSGPCSGPAIRTELGSVRGFVSTPGGEALPDVYSIRLASADGRRVERRLEGDPGEGSFTFTDVPFGAYRVSVKSPTHNGESQSVVLEGRNDSPYVLLKLRPAGFLEGQVVEEDGEPLAGLRVRLAETRTGEERVTTTGQTGFFRLEGVLDGNYELHLGSLDPPPHEPKRIAFRAPSMRYPTITLPSAARIDVFVVAAGGAPLGGVEVWIEGPAGRTQLETDARGRATAHFLPAGEHSVIVNSEENGWKSVEVALTEGERASTTVELPQ